MRRMLTRLLDGPHPWGELRVGLAARGAWRTYRLVVLPPGVDPLGRRLLRLRLSWPLAGALLGFLALVLGADRVGPALLTTCVVGGYVASTAVVFRLSRRVNRATLRINAVEFPQAGAIEQLGDVEAIRAAVADLERLDTAGLDPIAYELGWWAVYARLDAEPSGSRRSA